MTTWFLLLLLVALVAAMLGLTWLLQEKRPAEKHVDYITDRSWRDPVLWTDQHREERQQEVERLNRKAASVGGHIKFENCRVEPRSVWRFEHHPPGKAKTK